MRDRILAELDSTGLEELERVALLNRTDTKFLLAEEALLSVLPTLSASYRVLEVGGLRQHRYRTIYFDTPDWDLYHEHRTGQPVHRKVRSRLYADSNLAFLEVKSQDEHGRTLKHRSPAPGLLMRLSDVEALFLSSHLPIDAASLRMVLESQFTRVTLVHRGSVERLTLDFALRFAHNAPGFALPGLAIAEVKQSQFNPESPFLRAMAAMGVLPTTASKYCIGIARLNPDLDSVAFERALAAIEALTDRAS